MTRLVGLDLSLTSTGIARLQLDDAGDVAGTHTDVVPGDELARDATWQQRAVRIREQAAAIVDAIVPRLGRTAPDLVVVEGAPHASNTPGASELHGLRWRVYALLERHDVPLVEVNPSTLKLYAAANGRAGKPLVVQSIRRHYGDRFDIPIRKADGQQDVADAIALVAMAARSIGHPIDLDHPTRLRAMASPRWANRED